MTEFEQKVLTELAALSQSVADLGMLVAKGFGDTAQSIKEQNELFASVVGEEIANLNRRLDEIAVALMPQRGGHYTVPPQTT